MVFRSAGEGLLQAAVFLPAPAGLFLPPTAAFFTVVTAGVMHRMTVGMAVTTRRKTCFPTVSTTIPAKAKPPAVPTAFCVYFSPSPTLPKGRAFHTTASNTEGMSSRPLCKPLPNPPQREGVPPNRLKHSKNGLPPLGEGWGGASIHHPNNHHQHFPHFFFFHQNHHHFHRQTLCSHFHYEVQRLTRK